MNFVREYAAGADLPANITYSSFFQTGDGFYGLAFRKRQIYTCRESKIVVVGLVRDYQKIVPNLNGSDFYAYTQMPNKNEAVIYHLDSHFMELDYFKIRNPEGYCRITDLWFDSRQGYLFLVCSKAILKYSGNGDYLGLFMSAPAETCYHAMCTFENLIFLAYQKNGCPYSGMYRTNGSFIEQISLNAEYQLTSLQVVKEQKGWNLRLHVLKKGEISLFCELQFQRQEEIPVEYRAAETDCLPDQQQGIGIEVEIVKEKGIGETTCYIRPVCTALYR